MTQAGWTCRAFLAGLTISIVGCEEAAPDSSGPAMAVRDSAGVRIVEHDGLPTDLPTWSVASEPELRLGALDGTSPDVFGSIGAVAESESGAIVVADRSTNELRAFDASGAHLWTAGGTGEGPGELSSVAAVAFIRGDSVAVYDLTAQRVSIFAPDGRPTRDYSVASLVRRGPPGETGFTRTGGLIGLAFIASLRQSTETTRYEGRVEPLFFDAEGSLQSEGLEMFGGDFVRTPRFSTGLPMGARTQLAVGPDAAVVSTQRRFDLLRFRPSGALSHVVRVHAAAPHFDRDASVAAGFETFVELVPDTLPVLRDIRIASNGDIWVEEYVPLYEERTPRWWVVAPGGELVATVNVPAELTLRAIDATNVLATTRDSFGVSYVVRHRLENALRR